MKHKAQEHYENLKEWVDGNLICTYDDPVWNEKSYEAIHFILDDYKNRIDCQLNVEERIEMLEKALDKACSIISNYTDSCPYDIFDYYLDCENRCNNQCNECWKIYLMDENTDKV